MLRTNANLIIEINYQRRIRNLKYYNLNWIIKLNCSTIKKYYGGFFKRTTNKKLN